jgi:pimeloyl-ACP methyl ester carboxylesterase
LQLFRAPDGAAIHYSDTGTGQPLLLLHGLMAHGGFFREQAALADRFRLIAVDMRGHGRSRHPGDAPGVGQIAADIAALAEALDVRDAIGLGWSLGATVLWHVLAGPAGGRFAGAVVVDMTARVCNGDGWTLGLSPDACAARSAAIAEDFPAFAAAAGRAIFAQPVAPGRAADADWAASEFARNDPAAIAATWQSLQAEDARGLLARIPHPTLVIHGAHSHLYGADTAEHLAAALPNAQTLRFARSGHAPHLEQPDEFNRAIRDFADRLAAAPATHPHSLRGGTAS